MSIIDLKSRIYFASGARAIGDHERKQQGKPYKADVTLPLILLAKLAEGVSGNLIRITLCSILRHFERI